MVAEKLHTCINFHSYSTLNDVSELFFITS